MNNNPGFSRSFAKKHGVTEAIIFRYLANRIRSSKTVREGKRWFYNPIATLAEKWPYFGRSTVADALKRLEKAGVIEVGCFNKWKQDRTRWYTACDSALDEAEDDIIYFNAEIATEHGVCAGVIILNFIFLLKKVPHRVLRFSPTLYSRVAPFSVSTIRNAVERLIGADILRRDTEGNKYFGFGPRCDFKLNQSGHIESIAFTMSKTGKDCV